MVPLEAPYPCVYIDTFIFFLRSLCKILWMNVHYFPNAPRKNQLFSVYLQYGETQTITASFLRQGQQAIIDAHAAFLVVQRRRRRQKQCKSIWVRRWLSAERRLQYGQYDRLMAELRMEDVHSFFNFLRMQPEMFDEPLNRVGPWIQKNETLWRKSGTVNFTLPFTTSVTILISILQTFRSWAATSHLRPPMAFLSHNSSDTLGLAPLMNVLFWGRCDSSISFSGRDM